MIASDSILISENNMEGSFKWQKWNISRLINLTRHLMEEVLYKYFCMTYKSTVKPKLNIYFIKLCQRWRFAALLIDLTI